MREKKRIWSLFKEYKNSMMNTTMDIYAECAAEKKQEMFATLNGNIMVKLRNFLDGCALMYLHTI